MWAQSEIAAMVGTAARGAGLPLGQAQDLGQVATYLIATGGDTGRITAALQDTTEAVDIVWEDRAIHIAAGPAALIGPIVRDAFLMGCDRATLAAPDQAPLIAAYLAQAGIAVDRDGAVLTRGTGPIVTAPPGALAVAAGDWAIWARLAALTHVPESAASRAGGAGAGLTDND